MARKPPLTKNRRAEIMLNARQSMDQEAVSVQVKKRKAGRQSISRTESYPLETFLKLAGLSRTAYRTARANGLRTAKIGDSTWVTGEEWHRYISSQAVSGE